MLIFILISICSYLISSISLSYIIGRVVKKIDIREYGSGNAGATNSFRVLGWKLALPVVIFDFSKGLIFIIISQKLGFSSLQSIIVGLSSIVGHIYPLYFGFRGGKGVATSAGIVTALYPFISLFCLAIFSIFLLLFRRVSLASLITAISMTPLYILINYIRKDELNFILLSFFILISLIVFFSHRKNIKQIFKGNEKKLF